MAMGVKMRSVAFFFFFFPLLVAGQDTWYGAVAGVREIYNPAYSGVSGSDRIRLSSYSFLPGGGFGLNSIVASYDGFVSKFHGGVSGWVTSDFCGEITNDLRAGLAYSYHMKAGDNLFFDAGLTASVIHLGIKRSDIIFPDDIDPFGSMTTGASEEWDGKSVTRFDAATGLAVSGGRWHAGFSVMHLARPYLTSSESGGSRIDRKLTLDGAAVLPIGEHGVSLIPSLSIIKQGDWLMADAALSLDHEQFITSLSFWVIKDGISAIQPTLGWKGDATRVSISYAYNTGIPANKLPSTALVRVSLSFILNDVEKRRVIHIIKLPEM